MNTKFPSIEKLRHLVKNIRHKLDEHPAPPASPPHTRTIPLVGTTKLHGAHVDIVVSSAPDSSAIRLQSRNILNLTPSNDVFGFAAWMQSRLSTALELRDRYLSRYAQLNPGTPIDPAHPCILACEWIGPGVQKGVAVSQLARRSLVILTASINGAWLPDEPYGDICAEEVDVYNVLRGGVCWHLELDPEEPGEAERAMMRIVEAVEAECPFAKTFGVSGTGEGVVWKVDVADPKASVDFRGPQFWCKVKGEKHAVSRTDKVPLGLKEREKVEAFADAVVTEPRLEQGWRYLEEMGLPRERASTGAFVRWVVEDCLKEEREEMAELGVEERRLRVVLGGKARVWFGRRVDRVR